MHTWAKEIMTCVKAKVDEIGIGNVNSQNLDEFKDWTSIAKNIAEYDYYYNIVKAMEQPENKYGVNYDERGRYKDGVMYYTETAKQSDYEDAKEEYIASLQSGDMTERMKALEKMTNAVLHDVNSLGDNLTPSENSYLKQRFMSLSNGI